jgi:hypothetical protein
MKLKDLIERQDLQGNEKLHAAYLQLSALLKELADKQLSDKAIISINNVIEVLNAIPDSDKGFRTEIRKKQQSILQIIEKENKLVTKNHYRNTWLVMGMATIGVPLGIAFGLSLQNMAFLGIGIPIGMGIGIAIGAEMDKKALKEGRQLDIELKH